jgi:polyisoprenoid-binding protein YceI
MLAETVTRSARSLRLFAPAFALATALCAAAPLRAQEVDVDPDQLVLKYSASAGPRAISGVAHTLEWSVATLAGGSAKVLLQVPLDAFQTGQPALDAAFQKALEAESYPVLEVEGIAKAGALPVRFAGVIRLHGEQRPFTALLAIARAGEKVAVRTTLTIDPDTFGVERPTIGGAQLDRTITVDASLVLRINPQAVVSGGFVNPLALEQN